MITPKRLIKNAEEYPNEPAFSFKDENGDWHTDTWLEFRDFVFQIAKSLIALGVESNDKVCIYSYNRKEWFGAYAATQIIGAVVTSVYHTCSSDEVEWIVKNSNSKIVFVGNNPNDNGEKKKMPHNRILPVLEKNDHIQDVVLMKDIPLANHGKMVAWDDFINSGNDINESEIHTKLNNINENDSASLIYTSGTTGNPKGVELTHANWSFEVSKSQEILEFNQGENYVSWLPLAHVFGQLVDNHTWIKDALHLHVVDSPLSIVDYAKEVKPHLFIGVPRIYEKIYSNLKSVIDSKTVIRVGLKIPLLSSIFKGLLKNAVGFSNTRYAGTGAAPINPEILKLFLSLDIPLYEGYGMTENTAIATTNYEGNNKIGTVGKAINETEIKIADDGEILIRGKHVMKGYYKNPEATNETVINEWLHTGDIGKIDAEGYLSITGRIKEIYVSSGGKNIAPLVIEETMKSIPLVSQCYLVGDKRKYCTALFTLDVGVILRDKVHVERNKIPKDPNEQLTLLKEKGFSLADFTDSKDTYKEIELDVNKLNNRFSNPEQLKKFSILPRDFTIDDGELTPTLKIRRKQIDQNWSSVIESMYID